MTEVAIVLCVMLNLFQHPTNGCKDLLMGFFGGLKVRFRNEFGMTEVAFGMSEMMN